MTDRLTCRVGAANTRFACRSCHFRRSPIMGMLGLVYDARSEIKWYRRQCWTCEQLNKICFLVLGFGFLVSLNVLNVSFFGLQQCFLDCDASIYSPRRFPLPSSCRTARAKPKTIGTDEGVLTTCAKENMWTRLEQLMRASWAFQKTLFFRRNSNEHKQGWRLFGYARTCDRILRLARLDSTDSISKTKPTVLQNSQTKFVCLLLIFPQSNVKIVNANETRMCMVGVIWINRCWHANGDHSVFLVGHMEHVQITYRCPKLSWSWIHSATNVPTMHWLPVDHSFVEPWYRVITEYRTPKFV